MTDPYARGRGGPHEFRYEDRTAHPASAGPTPSQTSGPFFAYGLVPGAYGYGTYKDIHPSTIDGESVTGEPIVIEGRVLDGAGEPIHDAMVEIVQPDGHGRFGFEKRNDGFTGYARCGTGADGPASKGGDTRFRFHTVRPGPPGPAHAPAVSVVVIMRGLLNHCVTRMYFPEDDHSADPVMRQVPEARRRTLIAEAIGTGRYRFDIRMQGDGETVFFDV